MKNLVFIFSIFVFFSCQEKPTKPINQIDKNDSSQPLVKKSVIELPYSDSVFQTFESKEGDVTYIMKKYFIAFLKEGPNRNHSKEEATKIQNEHMAHLGKLADEKRACLIGPFGQDADSDIQGIIVFSVPDKAEAERLASLDPAVKAGRLVIEIQPWWAAKGSELF